jgi:hypothetical protein
MITLYVTFFAQLLLLLTLPLILAASAAYAVWKQVPRPRAYLVVATLTLYVVYVVVFYYFAPGSAGFAISRVDASQAQL